MSKIYRPPVTLFFSIFLIFLSYFYFGYNNYFYAQFKILDIILNGLIISSLLTLLILIFEFFISKHKYLKKMNNIFMYSLIIYISYHLLFRFSDISYFGIYSSIFSINNKIFKIFFYFYPFIISFFVLYFLRKEYIQKIFKFITLFLFILCVFSIFRVISIYGNEEINLSQKNDFINFSPKNKNLKNKKVFFLVFDEFDQKYLEQKISNYEYIKKFFLNSYVNKNFYSPAKFTMESIPAILTGNSIKKFKIIDGELFFFDLNNKEIHFNFENSIFNQKSNNKISSSIYGFYHPYCRIFKVENCYDVYKPIRSDINIIDSLNILSELLYINKILNLDTFLFETNNLPISDFIYKNNNDFLKSDTDIVFVHYPYPHLPLKTENFIKFKESLSDYEKNLWLVENTLKNAYELLAEYQGSLLIITSDHWFREQDQNKAHPIVFISKVIGDDMYYENSGSNNASSIKDLIGLFFEDRVENNFDIKKFFDSQNNHETYIRFN